MTIDRKLIAGIVLVPLIFGIAAPAFAEESGKSGESEVNETQALMNAKISIADAIRTAEAESKGKAIESGLNDEKGAASYQVEVLMPDGKRTDVFVDLQTGKVLKMADAGDEGGKNSEGGEQDGDE
jgi:Zn-dependent metalloprotease